jgi:hypothetical protein
MGRVITLLANNRLAAFDVASGAAAWALALAPPPTVPPDVPPGHYLALSRDGGSLYALPPDEQRGAVRLAVVDMASGRLRASYSLRATGAIYGSVAVGPTTGRLYLFGQRPGMIVVTVFDPAAGRILDTWTARGMENWQAMGRVSGDFFIYQGAVSPDEKRLFLSYYGGRLDLAGTDWLDITTNGLRRCEPATPGAPCLPGYAGFQLYRDGLLVTTPIDTEQGQIAQVSLSGKLIRRLNLRIGYGFLQDFALDTATDRLYAIGSCLDMGGLSMVDLATGVTKVILARLDPPPVINKTIACGQRLELISSSRLVIAKVGHLVADASTAGSLLVLDTTSGKIERQIRTVSEPLDLVLSRYPSD